MILLNEYTTSTFYIYPTPSSYYEDKLRDLIIRDTFYMPKDDYQLFEVN